MKPEESGFFFDMKHLFDLFYETSGVSTDTRNIKIGSLYISLKGTNFNGNHFAEEALSNGAKYAIVDEVEFQTNERIFHVENGLTFLQKLANYHRKRFNIPVIGITGSNGKTSTKELINSVLSSQYNVLYTKGNLNNHIGVPLTLLELTEQHEIAIIEMGANKFRDIAELCEIASPTHGIITNIGKAHLEGFGGFEGVLKTKKELFDSLSVISGHIVYNEDDSVLREIIPQNITMTSYGTADSNIIGTLIDVNPYVSFEFKTKDYQSKMIETHLVGKYNFYNFLAATSFGVLFNVPYEKIENALASYIPENNRSQVYKTDRNTLILDCYNANPTSMKSALESFAMINNEDKIFIIGDMLELGEASSVEHQAIADLCVDLGIMGHTVGPLFSTVTSSSFLEQFRNTEDARNWFNNHTVKGKIVLLKGSRGIGLEKLQTEL